MSEVKYGCMLERVHPCRQLQHVCIFTQHCIGFCYALVSNITLYYTSDIMHHYITLHCITQQTGGMQKPLPLNQQQLSRAWDVSQRSTAADWNEWLRRLNVDLLKESPSPALRSCSALAQAYTPLARDLFHAAFVSCWHELSEQYQDSLVRLKFILWFICCYYWSYHVHYYVSSALFSSPSPASKSEAQIISSQRDYINYYHSFHFIFVIFDCTRFEPCRLLSGPTQSHRKYCRPC